MTAAAAAAAATTEMTAMIMTAAAAGAAGTAGVQRVAHTCPGRRKNACARAYGSGPERCFVALGLVPDGAHSVLKGTQRYSSTKSKHQALVELIQKVRTNISVEARGPLFPVSN